MKYVITVIFGILLGFMMVSLIYTGGWLFYYDGAYKGKVVDEETNQPIEGAAVVAVWYIQRYGGAAGPIAKLLTAKEAVTDKNGVFKIPSMISFHWWPFATLDKPKISVFKSGFSGIKKYNYDIRNAIIQLPKARTRKERLKAMTDAEFADNIPPWKIPNFLKMLDEEYKLLEIEK